MRVNVALQIDAFSGQRIVWLSRDELETFSAQLRTLFDGLSDGASLQAMSPDEFCLEVVTKNSRRHWRARVRLSAHVHGDDATTLAGAIDIDSEYQSEILNGFRSLATTA